MPERTEQEKLVRLLENESREPIDTGELLAQGLLSQFGVPNASNLQHAVAEIEAHGDMASITPLKKIGSQSSQSSPSRAIVSEKLLIDMYDIRDELVNAFGGCKLNSALSSTLTQLINKTGSCITRLGGQVDSFDPLNHVSGLDLPDTVKNAEEVVARTLQCYKLGRINEAKIKDDGKEIHIIFEGTDGDICYRASGRIIAKDWTGNEAIDYIYTPNSGKMSVKAFEGGRWVSKDDPDDYNVSWELSENDISENATETTPVKEEVTQTAQNSGLETVQADGESDIGSPILV